MPPRRRPRRAFWPWSFGRARAGGREGWPGLPRSVGQIVEAEPHSESETDGTKGCKWNKF